MTSTSDDSVETGIESPDAQDRKAVHIDPDVWAYATGDEFGTAWAVERTDETIVMVETHRCRGDTTEVDGEPIAYDIDQGTSTEEWARHYANRSPSEKVSEAKSFFE